MSGIRKQVVVIGAGCAGMAAATKLYENGVTDLIIVEAEDRIGGRIQSIKTPEGEMLEYGASWIHSRQPNCIHDMAASHDKCQPSEITFYSLVYVRSTGEIVGKALSDTMRRAFRGIHKDFMVNDVRSFRNFKNVYEKVLEELEKMEYDHIPEDIKEEFIHNSLDLFHVPHHVTESWLGNPTYPTEKRHCTIGDHPIVWKDDGFKTLFDILLENHPKDFLDKHCLLNTEVTHISKFDYDHLSVECSNGKTYIAEHVICTVSLGVLQDTYERLFEKLLIPEEKIRAMRALTLGTLDKMYMRFVDIWWPTDDFNGFALLWSKSDRIEFRKKNEEWATGIFAITRVDYNPHFLCAWISGLAAKAMEIVDEKDVLDALTLVLAKFLGKSYKIPNIQKIYRTTWHANKHFRGAYSLRNLDARAEEMWSSMLISPIINEKRIPVLLFAGEAAHHQFYSTAHGAVESGWREADRLLLLKKTIQSREKIKINSRG